MKVFCSCAITGGMSVPGQSAAIPVTPEQIVDSAVAANAAGAAIGAVFPLCLAMCLDVAHDPADAGAASALMFVGGYLFAALAPLGLGAVRDVTGSFSASLWALFGTAVLLVCASLPLTATRLRPA